jgi:glycosyltransferase involved in cell wall biosynthesis
VIRVCFMVDAGFAGGAELYVSRLATALDGRAFAASVVMRANGSQALATWARDLEGAGVPVRRTPMDLPFHPAHAAGILRAIDHFAPHVVHVNMPGPYNGQNGLLVPIARASGARVLVTEHLPMVESLWKRAAVKRLAYRWLDLAVTVSCANAAFVRDRQGVAGHKIRVVYNGVEDPPRTGTRDAVRARLGVAAEDVVVWFVGNLFPHKGLQETLQAVSMIRSASARLFVVGDGPERGPAEALARAKGLESRVVFLGRRTAAEVRGLLAAGDLLALPSRIEGMPYTILEAMAAALPVVSTAVYGIPEAVADGDTGLLVPPGDVDALADALESLVGDAPARRRMGDAARARYERMFTLERHVAEMSALYRELATGRRGT